MQVNAEEEGEKKEAGEDEEEEQDEFEEDEANDYEMDYYDNGEADDIEDIDDKEGLLLVLKLDGGYY